MYIYDLEKIKNVLLGVIKGIEQNKWTLNKAIESIRESVGDEKEDEIFYENALAILNAE